MTGLRFKRAHYLSAAFAKWAQQAGVPEGYGAHGIRKRAAHDDAELRIWTHTQLKAKYGWETYEMADYYIKLAEKRRVALAGVTGTGTAG